MLLKVLYHGVGSCIGQNLPARAALFAFGRSDAAFVIKLESGASMNITNRDGCGHGYVESNSFPTSCFGLYERQAPKYLR